MGSRQHMVMIDPVSFIDVVPASEEKIHTMLFGPDHQKMVISSQPLPAKVWQRIKDPHVDMLTLDNTVYRIQRIPELGSGIVTGLQPCRCSSAFDSSCSSGSLPAFSPACSPPAAAASAKAPALTAQQHAGRPQFRSDSGSLSADYFVAGRENCRGGGPPAGSSPMALFIAGYLYSPPSRPGSSRS